MKNINIYAFADEAGIGLEEQIRAMQRNGLKGLEIRFVDTGNVSDISKEKAKEVKKKLDSAGLITWSIGSPLGKIDIEKESFSAHLEKFRHTLEIADILNSGNIRLFSFYIPKDKDPSLYKNEVIERLGTFLDIAKGSKINLCHENEKGIYGDTAERCLDIFRALPEYKGIFDPANFVQCKQDTREAWEMLKNYTYYMHIKDALSDGSVVPSGKGEGNVPYIVSEFIKNGGNSFTIEPHLTVFDGCRELEPDKKIEIGKKYVYESKNAAFDAACNAFKDLLQGEKEI